MTGSCGDNATYKVDADGTLTIEGTGVVNKAFLVMNELSDTEIKNVVISEGITELGEQVFSGGVKIESITLPSTLEKIGYQTFYSCVDLKKIEKMATAIPPALDGGLRLPKA